MEEQKFDYDAYQARKQKDLEDHERQLYKDATGNRRVKFRSKPTNVQPKKKKRK